MVRVAKVSSRGQVTIPLEIRKRLGLSEGGRLVFDDEGDAVVVRPETKESDKKPGNKKESVFEKWRGIGMPGVGKGRAAVLRWTRQMRGR